ncbi:hypothetical protein RND71_039493 [Anisodus tanguticus]|uniref:Uncharacterized protein n=1 Tax=Anisodus tanguticus TaxID=243964 RepID=A0AAE1QZB0_9SOLA|nr:hypothetical protein RND71_039493 [Anisodus tanguticus]
MESLNTNGSSSNMHLSMKSSNSSANMKKYGTHNGSAALILNGFNNGEVHTSVKSSGPIDATSELDTSDVFSATATERRSIEALRPSVDANMELIEGNMCSSATGVVRVRSRRKAEMFLVRIDGFLCNRKKVTESSLAFTHPSTQQQMLLWKSTPKTVLLLKKLGQELLEEAKEAMPGKVFDVLNDVVVDRGSNPYLSKIECYEHDRLVTKIPEDARSNAWVSFDGKRRQQLSRGDSIRICMSQHPLPTVNKCDQTGDWFGSLIRCLNWNERLDQKAL